MKPMTDLLYQTLRPGRLTDAIRPPDPVRLLFCWAMVGAAAGTVLFRTRPELASAAWLMQGMAVSDAARSLWDVCRSALIPMVLVFAGILLGGLSAAGQPLILLLLFSRGTAFGLAAGACFAAYPVRDAVVIAGALILPIGFVSTVLFAYAARSALQLSGLLTGFLLHRTLPEQMNEKLRGIIINMQICLLLLLTAAGLHTALLWLLNDSLLG